MILFNSAQVFFRRIWRFSVFVSLAVLSYLVCLFLQAVIVVSSQFSMFRVFSEKLEWFQFRFTNLCFKILGHAAGMNFHLQKPKLEGRGPFFLVSNHVSYLDILTLGVITPTAFLAKADIRGWPVIGGICQLVQCVFVDRDNMSNRIRAILTLNRVLSNRTYCVFPEGTTTPLLAPSGESWYPGSFLALAKNPEIKMVAVAIGYEDQNQIAWWGGMDFLPHLYKMFGRKSIDVYLTYKVLPVSVEPGGVREAAATALEEVCQLCEELEPLIFGLPVTKDPVSELQTT